MADRATEGKADANAQDEVAAPLHEPVKCDVCHEETSGADADTEAATESMGDDIVVNMTLREAEEELNRCRNLYPVVRMLDKTALENESFCLLYGTECPCMRMVCEEVLQTHRDVTKTLCMGDEHHMATARYVEVEGDPRIILYAEPFDVPTGEADGRDLIYRDALTGAYNRRYYEDKLRREHIDAGVAMIDLDDFKLVNDTHGHHVGDAALRAAVDSMQASVRDSDIIVRLGGDEFLLVMPGATPEVLGTRLREMASKVSETVVPGCTQMRLTVSVGGTMTDGHSVETAVRKADHLMYEAKNRRGCVITDAEQGTITAHKKPLVLIVDDSSSNRWSLSQMLEDEYEIIEAEDGEQGIEQLRLYGDDIAAVLLDIVMPGMSGFDVLRHMSEQGWIEDVPVVMISAEKSEETVLRSFEMGASDYIPRPFDMRVVRHRVGNTIRLYARQRRLTALLSQQYEEREKDSRMLIDLMAGAMELRNGESGAHVRHLGIITEMLLERLVQKTDKYELGARRRRMISMASALHDIGKMAIPDDILNKPGALTPEEYEVMKTHTTLGADMLDAMGQYNDDAMIRTARIVCRWHHERWDGGGYPDGLVGDNIPIEAQVVSLADVYDALTSERIYKKAYSHEETIRMIVEGECGAFNPLLLECLRDVEGRIQAAVSSEIDPPPLPKQM